MDDLQNVAKTILELMAASARTAPKGAGQDYIDVVIVDKDGCQTIGARENKYGSARI